MHKQDGTSYLNNMNMMKKQFLVIIIGLSLLSANPISTKTIGTILKATKNVYTWYIQSYYLQGTDVIINFEGENKIGAAWLEIYAKKDTTNWCFNYVRFDESGKILQDLRNFEVKKSYYAEYGIDGDHLSLSQLNYFVDHENNAWLIYSYETDEGWRIGWVKVDSSGDVVERKFTDQRMNRRFIVCPSTQYGFHLFLTPDDHAYWNSALTTAISVEDDYPKPFPANPYTCIEIEDNNLLLIGYNRRFETLDFQRISNKGKLLSLDKLAISEISTTSWTNIDFPAFQEIYQRDSLIYYLYSSGKSHNLLKLVIFDKNGNVIVPDQKEQRKVLDIEQMPDTAEKFMKMIGRIVYYFGIDDNNNLYYWNSQQKQR